MAPLTFQTLDLNTLKSHLPDTTLGYITTLILAYTAYLSLRIIYNLFFHPLAKYPGPFLGKIGPYWKQYNEFQLAKCHALTDAHRKYGPIVRVTPNELSFDDPRVSQEIYKMGENLPKSNWYEMTKIIGVGNIFSHSNIKQAAGKRKIELKAYSQQNMLKILPGLHVKAQNYLDAIKRDQIAHQPSDLFKYSHWLAFEVVFLLAFDRDPAMLSSGEPHYVMELMHNSLASVMYGEIFGIDNPKTGMKWPNPICKPYENITKWAEYAYQVLKEERETGGKTSFMSLLSETPDEYLGRTLNDEELVEEVMGMMVAGSGTTANTLTYIFYELCTHPEKQERLAKELIEADSNLPLDQMLPYETINKLPYLNAVIQETLRLWPTIPGTRPRVIAKEPAMIGGELIPVGTIVGMQNYVHHRNERIWHEANEWLPERWFEKGAKERSIHSTGFGSGPRNCIGMNLANMEMLLIVSSVIRRFKISSGATLKSMKIVDTFNGAPRSKQLLVTAVERSSQS